MELVAFLIGAVPAVYGAVQMVRTPNPVHAALYLVLNFVALAYLYLLLAAPFLAVVQVAVYAGAIMVLFLFIIMYMNLHEFRDIDPLTARRRWGILAALLTGAAILVRFISSPSFRFVPSELKMNPTVAEVGRKLLQEYALPFEIASVLLLVAMIGIMVMAKRAVEREWEEAGEEEEEGAPAAVSGA